MPSILISRAGTEYGPYTLAQVRQYLAEEKLSLQDHAWTEGLADWTGLADLLPRLERLAPAGGPDSPPAPPGPFTLAATQPADDLPAGVRGWCWGGFLLGWVWAVGNQVWLGLVGLVPPLWPVVALWLGLKGRELAWRRARWDNLEHFQRTQRRWSRWGVGLWIASFVLGMVLALLQPGDEGGAPAGEPVAAPTEPAPAPQPAVAAQPTPQPAVEAPPATALGMESPFPRAQFENMFADWTMDQVLGVLGEPVAREQREHVMLWGYRDLTINPTTGEPDAMTILGFTEGKLTRVGYR